jgi:ribonuclease HI
MQEDLFIDNLPRENVKNLYKVLAETVPKSLVINCDGASRGNPGLSSSGFVFIDPTDDQVVVEGGEFLGITTNNQAEYRAVLLALQVAYELDVTNIKFKLDSLLVVNQMNGLWKIKNKDLWPINKLISQYRQLFKSVEFTHVRREFNKLADAMANKVLDKRQEP